MTEPSVSIWLTNNGSATPSRFVIDTFNIRGLSLTSKCDQLGEDRGISTSVVASSVCNHN